MSDDQQRERIKEWRQEDVANLLLLIDHYGIEESDLMLALVKLSIALAKDLGVPAFTELKKRGRSKKWDEYARGILVADVERIMELYEQTVSWATNHLAQKEPWKTFVEENEGALDSDPGEVLRQIYYGAKDINFAMVARKSCKYQLEIEGSAEGWERDIANIGK